MAKQVRERVGNRRICQGQRYDHAVRSNLKNKLKLFNCSESIYYYERLLWFGCSENAECGVRSAECGVRSLSKNLKKKKKFKNKIELKEFKSELKE